MSSSRRCPGYGFSGKPTATGWDPVHIARRLDRADAAPRLHAVRRAGRRLGRADHRVMGAQGPAGAARHPLQHARHGPARRLAGARVERVRSGDPAPDGLSADEQRAYEQLSFLFTKGIGYAMEMGNRPQTLYGLADSPVALAAWMLDHDATATRTSRAAFAGDPVGNLTRDEVLDNITLTWLTNTGDLLGPPLLGEHARLLRHQGRHGAGRRERLPQRALPGAAELDREGVPEPHLLQRGRRGNHFAAWQEPELFSAELRAAFGSLR